MGGIKRYNKRLFHIIGIIAIVALVYGNSFRNEFVYDDHTHILENKDLRYSSNIPKFFTTPYLGGLYRPIRSLDYMLVYFLGGENSWIYHLHGLLLHIAVTIVLYIIVSLILRKNIAFVFSLLFAVHPIHTGRVTNITASFDLLGMLFMLLSFYFYILYSKNNRLSLYVSSMFLFLLGLFSSEEAIILPFLVILYELCFGKLKKRFKAYSGFFVLLIFYVILRFFVLGIASPSTEYATGSFYLTMLTMTKVGINYIGLLLFPINLTLYHYMPIAKSLFDIKVIFSIIALLSLIIISIIYYKKNKRVTFIIGWFFITLIPFMNILPFRILMAERYLYLASFAYCLLLAIIIDRIYRISKLRYAVMIIFVVIIVSYSTLTINRNSDWRDEITLWENTVSVSPLSSEAHDNLGFSYEREGKLDKAIIEFRKSINLDPSNYKAYTNLGTTYGQLGNFTLAREYLIKAVRINPDYYKAYNYLGLIYGKQGLFDQAISAFKLAIKKNPDFDEAYYNLGIVYEFIGEDELAKEEFGKAYKLNPQDTLYMNKIDEY